MPENNEIHWIAVEGDAELSESEIRFDPSRGMVLKPEHGAFAASPGFKSIPYCTLVSSKYFQRGRIRFQANIEGEDCRCQVVLNYRLQTLILAGLNVGQAAYGIVTMTQNRSCRRSTMGKFVFSESRRSPGSEDAARHRC